MCFGTEGTSPRACISSTHLSRLAYVYLRQSSAAQVEHNRESTARQYALVTKAAAQTTLPASPERRYGL
jgi:hypothetical protein